MPGVSDPTVTDRDVAGAPPGGRPPTEPPPGLEPPAGERAWGPSRVVAGILALVALALVEGGIVLAIDPAPELRPDAIAGAPAGSTDEPTMFALDTVANELLVLEAEGSDELREEDSIDVERGADLLAAGRLAGGTGVTLAVAGSNGETVRLLRYEEGELRPEPPLALATRVSSLAIGELPEFEQPVLAVGTPEREVALFGIGSGGTPEPLDQLTDLPAAPEALAIGRIDTDGRADLLVGAGRVIAYLSGPGGLPQAGSEGVGEPVASLALGDAGEGNRAFAITADDELQILRWQAGRGLGLERTIDPVSEPRSLAVAELFDGRSDLVVGSTEGSGRVEVVRFESDGSLETVAEYEPQQSLGARVALQLLLAASLAVVAFSLASPGPRLAAGSVLGLRRWMHSPWKLAALGYIAYIACAAVLAVLIEPQQENVTRDLGFGESELGDLASLLLIVVAAPISEEIFFRGFVFGGLRRAMPWVVAAVASALVWGVFHFTGPASWGVVVQLTIFGVVLAWLYQRTGSIWPAIVVHAVNNALAFGILTQ
jgi:membrane protease YdiL (CAAX protease family)